MPTVSLREIPSLEDLRTLCPAPWSEIDERCAEALDARYLDEDIVLAQLYGHAASWTPGDPVGSPATALASWRDVFADPVGARAASAAALARPECLSPGEYPEESCDADQIARLAMLHEACAEALRWYRGFTGEERSDTHDAVLEETWRGAVDQLDEDASLTLEEYSRRLGEIEDERFRFAWRLMRCDSVPRGALAWLDPFPTPTGAPGRLHQGRALVEAAARLGNDWAKWELMQDRETRETRFAERTGYPREMLDVLERAAEKHVIENPDAPARLWDPETGTWSEEKVVRYAD